MTEKSDYQKELDAAIAPPMMAPLQPIPGAVSSAAASASSETQAASGDAYAVLGQSGLTTTPPTTQPAPSPAAAAAAAPVLTPPGTTPAALPNGASVSS